MYLRKKLGEQSNERQRMNAERVRSPVLGVGDPSGTVHVLTHIATGKAQKRWMCLGGKLISPGTRNSGE